MIEALYDMHYTVAYAAHHRVGAEWNGLAWDQSLSEIGCHRLYYLTEGEGRMELLDREIRLLPGYIYLIPAFTVRHSYTVHEMNKYYIHFTTDSPLPDLYRYFDDRYAVPAPPECAALFETVLSVYREHTPVAHMKRQGAMQLLTAGFFAAFPAGKDLARFADILLYIGENYTRELSLASLGARMNMNPVYFANCFRRAFRISPKQYILQKRLAQGQRLLLTTDLSVKEIAAAVGFENANYFSELFTAKLHISPRDFRAQASLLCQREE